MTLGILVSGRGSNLEAVLEAGFEVAIVLSNRSDVRALAVAAAHDVPTRVVARDGFPDAAARDAGIGQALTDAGVTLALLAGYDQVLRPTFFATFGGRTINIHPSLLPAHGGRGMVGLAVHRSVLAAGDWETGVTIHEVTADLDAGPVIASTRVPVRSGDDPERLAARVLAQEHLLLVATLDRLGVRRRDLAVGGSRGTMRASMPAGAERADR